MVVTVGLSIMLRNLFLFQFGGRTRPLRNYSLQEGVDIGPITITPRDLDHRRDLARRADRRGVDAAADAASARPTRAVSDNPDLASATESTASR